MSNLLKKIGRTKQNKKKKEVQKELVKKIGLFNRLPSECSSCEKEFNKQSKEDHMTWKVNVMAEQEQVYLFCPDCQGEEDAG